MHGVLTLSKSMMLYFQYSEKLDADSGSRLVDYLRLNHDTVIKLCAWNDQANMLVHFQTVLRFDKNSAPTDITNKSPVDIVFRNEVNGRSPFAFL